MKTRVTQRYDQSRYTDGRTFASVERTRPYAIRYTQRPPTKFGSMPVSFGNAIICGKTGYEADC